MSRRIYNEEDRPDNVLRRAATNENYTDRERALIGIIAEMMTKLPAKEWSIATDNVYIRRILSKERENSLEISMSKLRGNMLGL